MSFSTQECSIFKTIAMSLSPTIETATIRQWIADKMDAAAIQAHLASLGHDDDTIALHLQEFKKQRFAKRQFTGFVYMGVGATIGFISCVLSIINPVPELYNWILYGMTSVAITVALVGLYFALE